MSYSLFLHFKPRVQRADVLKYFAARRHYKTAKDRVSYANEDTGAYFRFDLRYRRDFLLRQTVVSAELEINYHRPSFFALEAEQELSAFVEAFGLGIEDPQMHGMGNGPYSPHGFFSGWNFGNRFALQQALSTGSEQKIMTMPAAELQAVWDWNNDCAERRDRMNLRYYVPTILFWRIDGRACRVVVWGESMPILLPRVDYVIVARQIGKTQVSLVPWSAVMPVAKRAGFDSEKEPLELRYLTPPPVIVEWAASLPLIDLKKYERLHPHQILDEELIASAREKIERDRARPVAD